MADAGARLATAMEPLLLSLLSGVDGGSGGGVSGNMSGDSEPPPAVSAAANTLREWDGMAAPEAPVAATELEAWRAAADRQVLRDCGHRKVVHPGEISRV